VQSSTTLVIQSHRDPLPYDWIAQCLQSVRHWCGLHGFDYRFLGDELFEPLSAELRQKTRKQPVIASDLARLYQIHRALEQGYQCVIWCDADILVFAPQRLIPLDAPYALGREVWIQHDQQQKLKCYRKVHNAFLMFRRGNAFLDFYLNSAERLLHLNRGGMPAQFIGPKLLTALDNIVQCPVQENAGMLSPLVIGDIYQGQGLALDRFIQQSPMPIAAANLSSSLYNHHSGPPALMQTVIEKLMDDPGCITS
jgi:hypothetical protein